MSNDSSVGTRLEADRKDLLDLTLRNPLLNYKPRARGLEFVSAAPADVFRVLVTDSKSITFLHDPSAEPEPELEQDSESANALESPSTSTEGDPSTYRSVPRVEFESAQPTSESVGQNGLSPAEGSETGELVANPEAVGVSTDTLVPEPPQSKADTEGGDPSSDPGDSPPLSDGEDTADTLAVAEEADPATSPKEEAQAFPAASSNPQKLQTRLSSSRLESRLLSIYLAARSSIEEQGVNTLFLAEGLLSWSEPEAPKKFYQAPLILIPVELERTNARERFRLRHDGGDLGFNLSLAERLRAEARIELPELPEADDLDVNAYFDAVALAIQDRLGWEVKRESVALGFFSFGKFLMYQDLNEASWPEAGRPAHHPILQSLLGEGFQEKSADIEPIDENTLIDPYFDPKTSRQVVDADSSQRLALLDFQHGRNLVIQGPPGTGKSQTITNLIAEAVGQGKRVLFVAEKMAALEVVKRRLDHAGLGGACLELHSQKSKKKGVLDELKRTLELPAKSLANIEDDLRLLGEARDRLNAYCEAVNSPIAESGLTPHEAFGELARLKAQSNAPLPPRPRLDALPRWTSYDFKRRLDLVEQLQARLVQSGVPVAHPFWGSRRTLLLPSDEEQLRALVEQARDATEHIRETTDRLSNQLNLQLPDGWNRSDAIRRVARWLTDPSLKVSPTLRSEEWRTRSADVDALLKAGAQVSDVLQRYGQTILPDAWSQDLRDTRKALNLYGRRWWPWFYGAYRQAKRQLSSICRGAPPADLNAQLALIDAITEARQYRETIQHLSDLGTRLFGPGWKPEGANWPELIETSRANIRIHDDVQKGLVPESLFDLLENRPNPQGVGPLIQGAEKALHDQHASVQSLFAFLELDEAERFGNAGFDGISPQEQVELLNLWKDQLGTLGTLAAWNHQVHGCANMDLGELIQVAESWPEASQSLALAFQRWWVEGLLELAFRERSPLAGFNGTSHEQLLLRFRELDVLSLKHAQAKLAFEHRRDLPRQNGEGQLGVLRREFEKKTRHRPIRQLMTQAGNAVQAIKPVFMMSPLSVATFLPPGAIQFDLVVFDEASQVRPVDAFGALLRGRQAVVVGDSKQLPPTQFFDRLTGDDAHLDEEDSTHDLESILGLFVSQGAPQRMLRWHYRSRHESLIAVSNHEFYDSRLVVFPSPDKGRSHSGLAYHHLPRTHYDRGKTRTNPGEAAEVAQAAMDFAREQLARPEPERLTLGVAAFSTSQMQAIMEKLEDLRKENPECEEYFATGGVEPFFVKNLENVQGDERDVIFISVGYGRTLDGNVAMNFGPLNNEGGERRLNVLITRARLRCEIFTNLLPGDIDMGRTSARGVQALKTFLTYAQTGVFEHSGQADTEAPSRFEAMLKQELEALGLQVQQRVGSTGFRLELAVVDPNDADRFQLGITCDGPAYRSGRSARDRDRLRAQVLGNLGWRLHRIWSTEWNRSPESERARLESALAEIASDKPIQTDSSSSSEIPPDAELNSAQRVGEAEAGEAEIAVEASIAPTAEPLDTLPETAEASEPEQGRPVVPYKLANLSIKLGKSELHEVPIPRLAKWVTQVVNAEGPILVAEVVRRIADAADVKRVGARIQSAIDLAIDRGVTQGNLRRADSFLWSAQQTQAVVRDRADLPSPALRRIDHIAPEEFASAVERIVADALGIQPEEVPAGVARLLGLSRVTDDLRQAVSQAVEDLLQSNRIVIRGEFLVFEDVKPSA